MAVLSPQISHGKKNKQDFIEYLVNLLPDGNIPNPPAFGTGAQFAPSTYQDAGRNVLNILVPEPEDSIFGLMKPGIKISKKPKNLINNASTKEDKLMELKKGGYFYHIAGENYTKGDDLKSYINLRDEGNPPKWKWEHDEAMGGDSVDLFKSKKDAIEFQKEYGGKRYLVYIPKDPSSYGLMPTINAEGHYGIVDTIPNKFIFGPMDD